jgi:hypothetical protein
MARAKQDAEKPALLPQSQIDHLLLVDRGVDLLTPLATQLTYEGLIDEIFSINNSELMARIRYMVKVDYENETYNYVPWYMWRQWDY